jgi:hypothetical protein
MVSWQRGCDRQKENMTSKKKGKKIAALTF